MEWNKSLMTELGSISNCLYLCRPFRTFHVVAQLPGVNTPVCGLSSLRDFRVSPHELLLSRKPNYRRISRGALDFPRTAINFNLLLYLSPLWGLSLLLQHYRGFFPSVRRRRSTPPVCGLSSLRDFWQDPLATIR